MAFSLSVQVDLGNVHLVFRVTTVGRTATQTTQYTTSYKLASNDDGIEYYMEKCQPKVV